ncbi:hypothetical protein X797_010820 [Metarhizium robertsii]|uniref:Uncharacterized protein n=2 Tax=Metarhizium robertsii TaxID=568076 RepID=E9ESF9_METRA|nr:uncharacterized protein MAA_02905 [Metarhizium robertsii ARSEF 23]EFZ01676.1 hypothetical protein MAA_02905 [Metarhizium robertsii ARSEF 23]EXU96095.1 hypothetical protein X797_010820 [Metarhizium robertsii]
MFHLNILALALVPATTCLALPRHDVRPDTCCFTLHDSSTGEIVRQQTSSGFLYLGGSQPTGWYCIKLSDPNKILWDAFNNACFVNPDKVFQCLDPTPSNDSWGIEQSGSDVLVVVNRDSSFKVCPTDSGNMIYTSAKKDEGCRSLTLKAEGLKGSCGSFQG